MGSKEKILLAGHSILSSNRDGFLDLLLSIQFDLIIFDEVHVFKNIKSNSVINARKLTSLHGKQGLTGTIMQNNFTEYWTVLTTMHLKALPSLKEFNIYYADPIKLARNKSASELVLKTGQDRAFKIRKINQEFLLRRTKKLIQHQLPQKTENVVYCSLSELQQKVYEKIASGPDCSLLKFAKDPCDCGRARGNTRGNCCYKTGDGPLWRSKHPDGVACARCPWCLQLPLIHKLINCCNHLDLLKVSDDDSPESREGKLRFAQFAFGNQLEEIGGLERESKFDQLSRDTLSGKLRVLGQLLRVWKSLVGSKVLIFSHYTRVLDIIGKFMDRHAWRNCRIDGNTSANRRTELVDEFNDDPTHFAFLISTKSGGLGLNLTSANIVVLFDQNWNPSFDLQAQDRAYRLGQRRNVDVFRLISIGTIEDRVYCRQLYKMQLSSDTFEGNQQDRLFDGVMGVKNKQGELFGIRNLVEYNPRGHMAQLMEEYQWKPSLFGETQVKSKAAHLVEKEGIESEGFSMKSFGFVPAEDEEEDIIAPHAIGGGRVVDDEEDDLGILTQDEDEVAVVVKRKKKKPGFVESLEELTQQELGLNQEFDDKVDNYIMTESGEEMEEEEEEGPQRLSEVGSILLGQITLNAKDLLKPNHD